MTDGVAPLQATLSGPAEHVFPTLTAAQIARLATHGHVRSVSKGEVLLEAGDHVVPFFVVTDGELEIVRVSGESETLIRVITSGQFTGEVKVETHNIRHVYVMAGAVPNSGWLQGCVALDDKGFVKTGADLSQAELAEAKWPRARAPYLLETNLPGVFAVGDVRGGNVKRVASAVGEGSIAISFVHRALQD